MSRGIRWLRICFIYTFVAFIVSVLLALFWGMASKGGDSQLLVLYVSFPSSALAQGVAERLHDVFSLSYAAAGFWEALAGGIFGAVQYGVIAGVVGYIFSWLYGLISRR